MAKILSISSQVVSGHVGNSAITFTLQRLGHEVLPVPTILLSNHPGHKVFSGKAVDIDSLNTIFASLETNGHLNNLDAVITGYLPSPGHAECIDKLIDQIKSKAPDTQILIDPILGDTPKGLYIDEDTAKFIKHNLLPKADIVTPNFFELNWLADCDDTPVRMARSLNLDTILVTSVPKDESRLSNLLVTKTTTTTCNVPLYQDVPNGTGDFLAALYLGYCLNGLMPEDAITTTTSILDNVLKVSIGKPELQLVSTQNIWAKP